MALSLPAFIEPMLAKSGEAFDAGNYLFEIKWDGARALLFVENDGAVRMLNRRKVNIGPRYPELLTAAAKLPAGTLLDGEVVVLAADGRPDFSALQSRDHDSSPRRAAERARFSPATFVAFDQLYADHQPIMQRSCVDRREILRSTLRTWKGNTASRLIMSEGVVGTGLAFFDAAVTRGLEGMVAKCLSSPYLPGQRTEAWIKVKREQTVLCVVLGYVPEGRSDFGALVIASDEAGKLKCVGKVGTGFDHRTRARINTFLAGHPANSPLVPCPVKGAKWVEPGLYCTVRCMERTAAGGLRAPVLVDLIDPQPAQNAPSASAPAKTKRKRA